ncbi:low affinity iron permease family protein [Haloferula sp. BvORR071]|uniref:low affinity iron permease family protein n=1 Tax=Haloferula sp. BvORR071 TaxID=1396141 RepID=UPI000698A622|nr:low affinity iron permease family protein [Haloferula sp. BvORR071]
MRTDSSSWFGKFAKKTAHYAGRPATFLTAIALIVIWAASGPLFGFSDTWQLMVNTSTTIVTFLMVFLIQNSQNRDSEALQIKLDELIKVQKSANNSLLNLEDLSEEEIEKVREEFIKLAEAEQEKTTDAPDGKTEG